MIKFSNLYTEKFLYVCHHIKKFFTPERIALLLSGAATSFSPAYELTAVGLSFKQFVVLRAIYIIVMVKAAPAFGTLSDSIKRKLVNGSKNFFREAAAYGISLILYKVPIYLAIIIMIGATKWQIEIAACWFLGDTILTSWPCGKFLEWLRKKFSERAIVKAELVDENH